MSAAFALVLLAAGALAGCAQRLVLEGLVLQVDRPASRLVVSHAAVPGRMPAMVMPVRTAKASLLDRVSPGSRVRLRMRGAVADRLSVLRESLGDLNVPEPAEAVRIGEVLPDFELVDHQGAPFRLSENRGRLVVVQFLYTRCPLPEVCPRLAASFGSLQRRFQEAIPERLVLVSITLDPSHDTPEELARYARRIHASYPGWRFLTGAVEPVARLFGLVHWAEEGLIVHTSQTGLIDREGRLVALVDGSSYRFEQLRDLVNLHLAREEKP